MVLTWELQEVGLVDGRYALLEQGMFVLCDAMLLVH